METEKLTVTVERMRKYPAYKSHKVVRAFQIGEVARVPQTDTYSIYPVDGALEPLSVPGWWKARHDRVAKGGYVVFYEDGYVSYSPQGPFESGYTRLAKGALESFSEKPSVDKPVEYDLIHLFLVSGHCFSFHEVSLVVDNETYLEFDYLAMSDGRRKTALFEKRHVAGRSFAAD